MKEALCFWHLFFEAYIDLLLYITTIYVDDFKILSVFRGEAKQRFGFDLVRGRG